MNKLLIYFYGLFLLCFAIFSYVFIDPGLIYLRPLFTNFHQTHRIESTILFTLFVLIFFIFYFLFLYFVKKNMLSERLFIVIIAATCLALLFSYPAMLSF